MFESLCLMDFFEGGNVFCVLFVTMQMSHEAWHIGCKLSLRILCVLEERKQCLGLTNVSL